MYNISLNTDANQVLCLVQDNQGLMWVGTNKGLCSYDGFTISSHYEEGSLQNNPVYCIISSEDGNLILGTERGVQFYDVRHGTYGECAVGPDCIVRAIFPVDDALLAGTSQGLYKFSLSDGSSRLILGDKDVYSIVKLRDRYYISCGGEDGAFFMLPEGSEKVVPVELDGPTPFLFSLYADEDRNCIWLCARGLFRYDVLSGSLTRMSDSLTAKYISGDEDGNILLATDYGLFVVDIESGSLSRYYHSVYLSSSVSSNVIHCLYHDSKGNLWMGTDSGISFSGKDVPYEVFPLSDFRYQGAGNQFFVLRKDPSGNLWMGGNNGMVRNPLDGKGLLYWYSNYAMNQSMRISHNRVRDILVDRRGRLWSVTDRDLMLYDEEAGKFRNCHVSDPGTGEIAYWFFDILEDAEGYLWLSTFKSGVFKVDPDELEDRTDCDCLARYTESDGLGSNYVSSLAYCSASNSVYCLNTQLGLDRIDCSTGTVSHVGLPAGVEGQAITSMEEGMDNRIWLACNEGVLRLDGNDGHCDLFGFGNGVKSAVTCMEEVGNDLWVCSKDGIWLYTVDGELRGNFKLGDDTVYSICYGSDEGKVYLGGNDFFIVADNDITASLPVSDNPFISRISVNGEEYFSPDGVNGRFLENVRLRSDQNNISIEFADVSYPNIGNRTFMYAMNGGDMVALANGSNRIDFQSLKPGKYDIAYCIRDFWSTGAVSHLSLQVRRPLLSSIAALIIYGIFFMGIAYLIFLVFYMRNRMKYERLEKENALKQAEEKKSFISDISHELKTPLSMILGPVGKMLSDKGNEGERKDLELIKESALKIDNLIHKAIEFDRFGVNPENSVIRMELDLVDFSDSILSAFREQNRDSGKEFIFTSSHKSLPYLADAVKLESILNNLVSNACKYTSSGDSIILSLNTDEANGLVVLKLTDTGVGIAADELPYVFQKFYQSPTNSIGKEGSGIGLSVARNYAGLMGGDMTVESEQGKGTSFSVFLPLEYACGDGVSKFGADSGGRRNRPVIVIVEDNLAIAEFLRGLFADDYDCLLAHNGKSGLSLCAEVKPDLVITDIMMPVMDGREMCVELKKNPSTASIPIIVLTAVDDKKYELLTAECDIDAFVTKPFDSGYLSAKARRLIERNSRLEKKIRMEMIAEPKEIQAVSADEKFLAGIVEVIEDNISDSDFNVNGLCEHMGISSKQLYRKCKQLLGMTPVEYLRYVRLKKAALLLEQHQFNVSEAMYMVGFNNQSYFSKCFLKEFGMTPQQYRNSRK